MGSIYLDWLDDVVAQAAADTGYAWDHFDGSWLYRARSSGGYDSLPLCVMWHHTAGGDNAWSDAEYQCYQADARPIANITVDSKIALVLAGGATNTNGSGSNSPMSFSRGTVAKDDMNKRAVGIEICNNGVGAPYPEKQINFLIRLSNLINNKCGNQPTDCCTHEHYAPDRKIDPSKNSAVQGAWRPGSVNSSGSWNCGDLRNECKRRWSGAAPAPSPTPTPETEEDMFWRVAKLEGGAFYIGDGKTSYTVGDSGHQKSNDDARVMMAPGAVNVLRCAWDKAVNAGGKEGDELAGPRMVTEWGQIKGTCQAKTVRKYCGDNPAIK